MIDPDKPFPEHDPLPDRCLFCGSAIATMKDGRPCRAEDDSWIAYTCLSSVHRSRPPRKHQSTVCHALEFAQMRSRITDLENEKRGLLERIKRMEEHSNLLTEAGNELFWSLCPASTSMMTERERDALKAWTKAKETKP